MYVLQGRPGTFQMNSGVQSTPRIPHNFTPATVLCPVRLKSDPKQLSAPYMQNGLTTNTLKVYPKPPTQCVLNYPEISHQYLKPTTCRNYNSQPKPRPYKLYKRRYNFNRPQPIQIRPPRPRPIQITPPRPIQIRPLRPIQKFIECPNQCKCKLSNSKPISRIYNYPPSDEITKISSTYKNFVTKTLDPLNEVSISNAPPNPLPQKIVPATRTKRKNSFHKESNQKVMLNISNTIPLIPENKITSKRIIENVAFTSKWDIEITAEEIARLVDEETKDIDNTLKMIPLDLILPSENIEIKRRIEQIRLNAEVATLLEDPINQSQFGVVQNKEEPLPETMASVMFTIETGINPDSSPDQVFKTLFPDFPDDYGINVNSISPGPLENVVIATAIPKEIQKHVMSKEMKKEVERKSCIQAKEIVTNLFNKILEGDKKFAAEKNKKQSQLITDEKSSINVRLEYLLETSDEKPVQMLNPFDLDEFEKCSANCINYFLQTNPIQYIYRVQLRGSGTPSYFPGYMVASSDFHELIKKVKSPDEAFSVGWKSVHPKYFDEKSIITLIV